MITNEASIPASLSPSTNAVAADLKGSPERWGYWTQIPAMVRIPTGGRAVPRLNVPYPAGGGCSFQPAESKAFSTLSNSRMGSRSWCIARSKCIPENGFIFSVIASCWASVRSRGSCDISHSFSIRETRTLIANSAATPITTINGKAIFKSLTPATLQFRSVTERPIFRNDFQYSPTNPTATKAVAASIPVRYQLIDSISVDGSEAIAQRRAVLNALYNFRIAQVRNLIVLLLVFVGFVAAVIGRGRR